jgi:two-component system response regulator AlgR
MKILIVDDEPLARNRLEDLLNDIGGVDITGFAANGREALEKTQTLQPDLILLDIRMPELSGLEVAMHLAQMKQPPAVIFTTAYSDHALEAFDANAVDYLLKPIRHARLEQALAKANPPQPQQLADVAQAAGEQARKHISAHHRGGLRLIPIEEVIYFQADSKYVVVHHENGEVLIDEALKGLEQEFADSFTRTHRSALVANHRIEALEKDADGHYHVKLRGIGQALEVSRRQLHQVRKIIADIGK